jgi:pyruvate dehydrogenase E2 component (dihydrolipoamide acetyltransferase)
MAVDVVMPRLGLTMEEGKIITWLKKEGERVVQGEALLGIETDKVSVEVEAPASGTLGPVLFPDGATVTVGQVITYILAPGEVPPRAEPPSHQPSTVGHTLEAGVFPPPQSPERPTGHHQMPVSPVARGLAAQLGIDLTKVVGTGPQGRVLKEDVQHMAAMLQPEAAENSVEPLQGLRKVVAQRMLHSFQTAPHFYLCVEVDASQLLQTSERLRESIEKVSHVRLTFSDLVIKIAGQALHEHPEVNVVWDGVGIRRLDTANVGLAVATERGLIVPVLHDVVRKSLAEISSERHDLVEKVRSGRISLHELEGGSFTVSNLGTFAIDQFIAIINPPQAAIVSIGRIKERPVAVNGQVAIRPTVFLTLSADHRILDGAEAAQFLGRFGALIEEPSLP